MNSFLRYTQQYLLQPAILPGPGKPKDLDSFLVPIVAELKDLAQYGLVLKQNGSVICRSKVHLLFSSGDIPAVADMGHFGAHSSYYGCRVCEIRGKAPENVSRPLCFENCFARLRPMEDFVSGNPVS